MNDNTKIAEMMVELVEREVEGEISLSAIERTTRRFLQEIGRQTVELSLKRQKPTYAQEKSGCKCGQEARYVRQRVCCLRTLFGKVHVKRGYYLCPECHQGHYPLDERLDLRPNRLSAEVSRLVAMTGVQLPFEKGRALFEALTLVSVSDQTMGKATREVGEVVVAEEKKWQAKAQDEVFLRARQREGRRPVRLYGSLDAAKIHIRDDDDHRWRDVKIGAWFEAAGQPPSTAEGEWTIKAHNISYYADICAAAEFGQLVWSSGVARDAQLAHELVILGDGADWIWNQVQANFPGAIEILDWFHASQHLMPIAQDAFDTPEKQAAWVSDMKQLMWAGHIEELISACDILAQSAHSDEARKAANYFDNHRQRMRYAFFRQQGYHIGSGTIESAAKQIGLMRMKVPGAIWNVDHARLVAKARASYLSDRWHTLPLAL